METLLTLAPATTGVGCQPVTVTEPFMAYEESPIFRQPMFCCLLHRPGACSINRTMTVLAPACVCTWLCLCTLLLHVCAAGACLPLLGCLRQPATARSCGPHCCWASLTSCCASTSGATPTTSRRQHRQKLTARPCTVRWVWYEQGMINSTWLEHN